MVEGLAAGPATDPSRSAAASVAAHNTTEQNERNNPMRVTISTTPPSPRRVHCLALLAAFTLAFATQSARAGEQVPFRAAFTTQFVSTVAFPIAHLSVIGQGRALHMGATTAVTTDQAVNL